MMICDGKHEEQVEGMPNVNVRSVMDVDGIECHVQFAMAFNKNHFCKECFVEKANEIDVAQLMADAKIAKA